MGWAVLALFVFRTKERDELQKRLAVNKIGSLIHYPIPPHLQKAYAYLGYGAGSFAEKMSREVLSLSMWPQLQTETLAASLLGQMHRP